MTTATLILLDDAVALLAAAAWFASAATAAVRRVRAARSLVAVALVLTMTRGASVALLADRGWWFVQEKVLLGLPMLLLAAVAAIVLAWPGLRSSPATAGPRYSLVPITLISGGFAALAAFVVTILVGFPLTTGAALITIALMAGVVLLTRRVLTTPDSGNSEVPEHPQSGLSRRRVLGAAGGLMVAGAGVALSMRPHAAGVVTHSHQTVSLAALRGPSRPAVGGSHRRFVLTAQRAGVRLESGEEFDAWTYNGSVPGPPITVGQGDLVEVRLLNKDIADGVTIHWHGYDVPCGDDGVPGLTQDAVEPGQEFVYRFRADQVGTYWYHTHFASHRGVARGLFGAFVVKPRGPADQVDAALVIHTFNGTTVIAGEPEIPVGTTVRLRVINTDSRSHRLALVGTAYRLAAVDGQELEQPDEVTGKRLSLPAGGRRDLVFVMPSESVAVVVDDHAAVTSLGSGGGESLPDPSGWPELNLLTYGAPLPVTLRSATADRSFTMVLDRGVAMVDGSPAFAQTVNGLGHPNIPDQVVREGDIVRFTVVNRSLATHPWHLHGHRVLILSKDGKPSSGSPLWVDTIEVRPGEVWKIAFRATNPGIWMNHCHNLPHADQGMMLLLRYEGITTPFNDPHRAHATR